MDIKIVYEDDHILVIDKGELTIVFFFLPRSDP